MRVDRVVLSVLLAFGCSKPRDVGGQQAPGEALRAVHGTVIRPARITASSEHLSDRGYTFVAANLLDGALNTSWLPSPIDQAYPRWVRLEFDGPVTLTSISIANGFQAKDRSGTDEFLLHRRISKARLHFDDDSEIPLQFESNARGHVRFAIPNKTTNHVYLLIDDTYASQVFKYAVVAVSEIETTGFVPSSAELASSVRNEWWTPPPGERKTIAALAYGFAGTDEKALGTVFTADFKPIHGVPNLFENRPPLLAPQAGIEKLVIKLRNSPQPDANVDWILHNVGTQFEDERDYQFIREMQANAIFRVDESARMRRPPPTAMFYLAEVHRGTSFDLFVEGRRSAMGARLALLFAQGGGTAKEVRASGNYHLKAFGSGLRDLDGEEIFAMTPERIQETHWGHELPPVQLVFRTIPGRDYQPRQYAAPVVVVDEPGYPLYAGSSRTWTLPPGTHWIDVSSRPNGCRLAWAGNAFCDNEIAPRHEYTGVSLHCRVPETATLSLLNPSKLGFGPTEMVSVYIERK